MSQDVIILLTADITFMVLLGMFYMLDQLFESIVIELSYSVIQAATVILIIVTLVYFISTFIFSLLT